jgi:hypothetical protein
VTESGLTVHMWGSAPINVRAQPVAQVRALAPSARDVPARKQFGVALFDRVYLTKIQLKCFEKFIPKL